MHVAQLLDLLQRDPGRPRLTWYGDDSERVELSGAVLANWVSKTTNLLVEEFDAAPGTQVTLDLPVHWRTMVWALATWRTGATVVLPGSSPGTSRNPARSPSGPVVTDAPDRWAGTDELVVVSLPALARRYDGDLPRGAMDAAAAVMTYGDVIGWAPAVDPDEAALVLAGSVPGDPATAATGVREAATGVGQPVAHRDLVPPAVAAGPRVLADGRDAVGAVLREVLAAWAGDGSVVLTSAAVAAALEADAPRRERIVATERVTSAFTD
ncbi:TIGR03089 family protein [Antribacter sp. KLBMP9083]|uniref:TIGR03089 family protein n=1 Tax=Antribacter soli TaxID=2910976 RepID=A0AA41QAZ7_9MICO|nr:TIGR03089 family protein [Antribacter soli]MCF4120130.1 TIGR03089 family protein [Antribacter soli]